MQDYAEAVVFVFRVDSEGASSVEVCARVCVSWKPFLFQQHRIVNSNLKPWYFLFMFVNWMGALELEFETKKGYH